LISINIGDVKFFPLYSPSTLFWWGNAFTAEPNFQMVKADGSTPLLASALDCRRYILGLDECARDNPLIVRKAEASVSGHDKRPHEFVRLYRNGADPCQPGCPNGLRRFGIVSPIAMPLTIWGLRFLTLEPPTPDRTMIVQSPNPQRHRNDIELKLIPTAEDMVGDNVVFTLT
jgi:hypothetical protein